MISRPSIALGRRGDPRFNEMFHQSAGAVLEEVDRLKRTVDEFNRRYPKTKDDLQAIQQLLKGADLPVDLQFVNYR